MNKDALENLLENVLEAPSGVVKLPMEESRAKYLQNQITALIRETAVESFQIYPPDDPLYGKGLFSPITTFYQDDYLYIVHKRNVPPKDPVLLICGTAATQTPITITCASEAAAANYATRAINARRSLWRAVRRAVPNVKILALLESVKIAAIQNKVYISLAEDTYTKITESVSPEDATAILAAIAERESLSGQALDNGTKSD